MQDFFEALRNGYDRRTLVLTLPRALDTMIASRREGQWEIWRSDQIQSVKVYYEHNVVCRSIGVVFVNTYCKSKFHDLKGNEQRQKLEELYVPLRMAEQKRSEEAAREDFANLTEAELAFHDAALLRNAEWKDASERGDIAS